MADIIVQDEHEELVAELPKLENLSAEARLLAAKKRRNSQLQRYKSNVLNEDLFPPAKKSRTIKIKFDDSTTLIEAAARNDAEEVEKLLKEGISPDLQNQDGLSALHQAVIEDCDDVVHVLVEGGASLNIKDADLWTPLHAAVACENCNLVSFLVENGADLVAINADGNMPIDLNDDNENQEIEVFLDEKMTEKGYTKEELENIRNAVSDEMLADLRDSVQKGRDLNVTDHHGATAMHIAAANGYEEVIEFLIDNGAIVDAMDKDGWQPIHAAACWGQDVAIEILFNNGGDLDAKTNEKETPFDLTEDEDILEIMKELKESGRKLTKSVKRSQSNSSRTLCVRRLSLVDKHQTSKNDAVNEGIFFQKSEVMNVMINADDDAEDDENKRASLKAGLESGAEEMKMSSIVAAPIRPLIGHDSNRKGENKDIELKILPGESDAKRVDSNDAVDQSAVNIAIKQDGNMSDAAPVAMPEIDSPMVKKDIEIERCIDSKHNDSRGDNNEQELVVQDALKPSDDEPRNGKILVKQSTPKGVKNRCVKSNEEDDTVDCIQVSI
eukprot:gene18886-20788_t